MSAAILVQNLTRKFGDFIAVDGINFEVNRGELFGFLGPNGAGKSTTIKILTGIFAPTSGTAIVNGVNVSVFPEKVKSSIGYMSQLFSLYRDLTVRENLEFFGSLYDIERGELKKSILKIAEELQFNDYLNVLTEELPVGIRQRVAFACAILHKPSVVFLDEPTAGVDPALRKEFWNILSKLAREGMTFFITTHHMEEAERCSRVAFINRGKIIAEGTPLTLKKSSQIAVVEVKTDEPEKVASGLKDFAVSITFKKKAARIVYRVENEEMINQVLNSLLSSLSFEKSLPGLEDVFLYLTLHNEYQD